MIRSSRKLGRLRALAAFAVLAMAQGAAASVSEKNMHVDGLAVHYKVVLPDGYDPEKGYPAVLVMGGGPQSMDTVDRTLERNFRAEAERRGYIVVAPAAPGGAPPGSAFTLTLTNVNGAACPALASVMQRVSDIIAVQGKAGPVVVKNALAVPALPYRAQAAQAQCVAGDRNTFVFTAR